MCLHTWRRHGPRKPRNHATFTLDSHWGRAATGKKKSSSMRAGSLWSRKNLCDPVDCGLPGFSVEVGVLQAKTLERTGQYWLPHPSRALYFLLP